MIRCRTFYSYSVSRFAPFFGSTEKYRVQIILNYFSPQRHRATEFSSLGNIRSQSRCLRHQESTEPTRILEAMMWIAGSVFSMPSGINSEFVMLYKSPCPLCLCGERNPTIYRVSPFSVMRKSLGQKSLQITVENSLYFRQNPPRLKISKNTAFLVILT